MKKLFMVLSIGVISISCASNRAVDKKTVGTLPTETQPVLVKVAEFKGTQVTGVTVTDKGRIFANFPRWRRDLPYSVVEVMTDGTPVPYPNKEWNKWRGKPEKNKFTCVQSVIAYGDSLFVLDPASPQMEGVVGEAKLYEFDLATNNLKNEWTFPKEVAPKKSYLNDLRIAEDKIYITDSGMGGIVVLDMNSGKSRRLLDNHPSTKAESVVLTVDKKSFLMKGKAPKIHSDGIALSKDKKKLYFHALTGYTLYSVPTEALNDENLSPEELGQKVSNLGTTPAPDGMIFDNEENLYMADLERNAIAYRTPKGEMKILIQDSRLKWPDTFTIDSDNNLIFTDSLLHEAPAGSPVNNKIFSIYKVAIPREQ